MKLAEALLKRKELQDHLVELEQRINNNILVQEGDKPFEDAHNLILEFKKVSEDLAVLIKRINQTNINTAYNNTQNLAEALVDRDLLTQKRNLLHQVIQQASDRIDRYSLSEIKTVTVVDVKALIKQRDLTSKALRELDTKIQELNWTTNLL